jgi:hypothetical protein
LNFLQMFTFSITSPYNMPYSCHTFWHSSTSVHNFEYDAATTWHQLTVVYIWNISSLYSTFPHCHSLNIVNFKWSMCNIPS